MTKKQQAQDEAAQEIVARFKTLAVALEQAGILAPSELQHAIHVADMVAVAALTAERLGL
jgi:hypothetical protein